MVHSHFFSISFICIRIEKRSQVLRSNTCNQKKFHTHQSAEVVLEYLGSDFGNGRFRRRRSCVGSFAAGCPLAAGGGYHIIITNK
jgi:hypothetical protein